MLRKLKQMFWGRPVEAEQPKLAAIASIAPWEHPASYRCANLRHLGVLRPYPGVHIEIHAADVGVRRRCKIRAINVIGGRPRLRTQARQAETLERGDMGSNL